MVQLEKLPLENHEELIWELEEVIELDDMIDDIEGTLEKALETYENFNEQPI